MDSLAVSSITPLQKFLSDEARSVEHLFLEWTSLDGNIEGLSLSGLHRLQSLHLSFPDRSESCQTIAHIVCSMRCAGTLRSVILLWRQDGHPPYLRPAGWHRIDATLADTERFGGLREVVVRPRMMPFLPECAVKQILRPAETKFPLKTRWIALRSSAYPQV
ncbi:hypothetical protein E1B28_006072 [Marasmius oreades]|uniref:Uncharacterized protein n=1 Tax=Marasmius oreades TaxID=181124 RepID=A0A9P7S4G4_9AGAR|nr:uncharacterized protein E1B28_006072 [Marasmius oreades]KAG7095306.1 hypothetical protein E1B28_006072 [Marasmius oreades]